MPAKSNSSRPRRPSQRPLLRRPKIQNSHAPATSCLPLIVFEDPDLLVLNKPAGLITSSGPRDKRTTLEHLVRDYFANQRHVRFGLIHRLDADAAGLLIFSKNESAYRALKDQFFHHTVERVYAAVVAGLPNPPAAAITSRLLERADGKMIRPTNHHRDQGQLAITHYKTIGTGAGRALLRVTLETGRKHQIRFHLAQKGHPILGDHLYGNPNDPHSMHLIAIKLIITHPTTQKRHTFKLDLPKSFLHALKE